MKKTKHLTFCAILSALSIVVLLLGGISQILDLTAVVACAIIIFIVHSELKYSSLLVYITVSLLAFLILGTPTVAVEYVVFAIYPILKPLFEKAGKILGALIKYAFMIISSATLTLLFRYVLMAGDVWYIDLIFGIGLAVCYIIFDVALSRFAVYYKYKLRHQLRIDKFFH